MSNISIVEGVSGSDTNGADVTLTFGRAIEDDYVVVCGGYSSAAGTAPTAPTGYTEVHTSAAAPWVGMWYKIMGATPDTSVVCDGGGNALDGVAYSAFIVRGADTTTFLDVAAQEIASRNPAAITPTTSGSLVVAFSAADAADASVGTTDQEMFFIHHSEPGDANDIAYMILFYHWVSGAYDPTEPTLLTPGASGNYSITAAFRNGSLPGGGGGSQGISQGLHTIDSQVSP